jgi:hypothetical protein
LKERWQSYEEIRVYYEKRLRLFRPLWLHQVMVFLTTLMRALPAPEDWTTSLAHDLVEFLNCVHVLIRSSFPCPFHMGLQANSKTWSTVWYQWMVRQFESNEEASLVYQVSIHTLELVRLPMAGIVSFLGQGDSG